MFRYSTLLAVLTLLVLVVGIPSAMAQAGAVDVAVQNQVTTNNCSTAEPAALSGNMHFEYTFNTDSDGVNHFTVTVTNNLTGVGQNSGGTYGASDSSQYQLDNSQPSGELTVDFRSDLTPQNGGASLTLIQSLDITVDTSGNIAATVSQNATQCGSGS